MEKWNIKRWVKRLEIRILAPKEILIAIMRFNHFTIISALLGRGFMCMISSFEKKSEKLAWAHLVYSLFVAETLKNGIGVVKDRTEQAKLK